MASQRQLKKLTEPDEILPGLYRIRLPQPKYGSVYVHLAKGGAGPLTLFDAGLPHEMTQDALGVQLTGLGLALSDLEQVVYTHSHVDHMGGGYVISGRAPKAKHVAFKDCIGLCENFPEYNRNVSSWKALISHLNYEPAIRDQVGQFIPMDSDSREKVFSGQVEPESAETSYHAFAPGGAPIRFSQGIQEGEVIEAGPYRWEVVETPGHNPHHVIFLEEQRRVSITGDLILDHGTPIMRSMGDDVSLYMRSLARVSRCELGWVLPSHGRTFPEGNNALRNVIDQREKLLDWTWSELERKPQRLVNLSLGALQAGAAGEKANPILLIGVLESALFGWRKCGVADFDTSTGHFRITFEEGTKRGGESHSAA